MSMVDLVAYPVYSLFSVARYGSSKTAVIWFLSAEICPVLVVQLSLLHMLSDDSLLLRGRRPCWYLCRLTRVGREDQGGTGDASLFLGREDEVEVAVLASVEVTLNVLCVHRQELVGLLYFGVVRLD